MRLSVVRLLSMSASLLFALTITSSTALAQFTSAIEGTVTDPNGSVVSKAAVTIKSSSTGIERTVETSDSGYFRISSLPAATFTVIIKAGGFKTTQKEITLEVAQIRTLNIALEVGAQTAEVVVTTEAPQIESAQASVSNQIDPKDENNYLDLATLCVDHANYDLGLEIVSIGIRNIPQSDRLYFQRGTLLAMKGQSAQAVGDFEAAIKIAPDKSLPYAARGIVLLELGETSKAIALLRQRATVSRDDYMVHYVLGEALNRGGPALKSPEENEAIQALEKSVRLDPDFAASRAVLGKLLLRRNEVDRAISELEKALELDPQETSSLYQLAQAHRKKGNLERAKELFAKVDRVKSEERDKFMNRTLLRLVREGSK